MLWHLIFVIFDVQWVMPFSIKNALITWWGAFVGKKRKKAWKVAPCAYFRHYGRREIKELLKILN